MTEHDLIECSPLHGLGGFRRFCELYAKIEDKEHGQLIPFELWPFQVDPARRMIDGEWLILLKARQLGLTWLTMAYAVWRMVFVPLYTVVLVCQKETYAKKTLSTKWDVLYRNLPEELRGGTRAKKSDSSTLIELHNGAQIHAVAGNQDAGRSDTINLVVMDECARIDEAEACYQGASPGLKNAKGQCVLISSSAGPRGWFYRRWGQAEKGQGRFGGIFIPWHEHPERDQAWYDVEAAENAGDPNYMRQEFPASPEEAFEASGGRIYPAFRRRTHVSAPAPPAEFRPEWPRYRSIDWGETVSAFCSLWVVEIPSETPRLTVDPSCVHTIEEMLGYVYKPDTDTPVKTDDHACDALRMVVATFGLVQWVHVYRELYVTNPTGKGHVTATLCQLVKEHSGWELADALRNIWTPTDAVEEYAGTCFDRSKPLLANEFQRQDIEAIPHMRVTEDTRGRDDDVAAGIILVRNLVVGTVRWESEIKQTDADRDREFLRRPDPLRDSGIPVKGSLRALRLRQKQKRLAERTKPRYLGGAR